MASSSSSASNSQCHPQWKYEVFLSFRGADTRKTFTGHLYEGLKNRGIFTFQDDKRLEHGDSVSEELLKAIKESQVSVIIFSKNYAASRWCLDELVKIMECKGETGQTVIPVFYDVDPSTIRYQRESFAEAFAKHESKYKNDVEGMQKVQRWRKALTEVVNLNGCDIRDRIESDCIQHIVDQISSKLCKTSVSYLQNVVGIGTHLEKVKSLLEMEINDVRIVGIWGIGGVGKTTLARAIFDTISNQFDGACFLADVKENKSGMHALQNILLSELLREKVNYVNNKEDGKHLIDRRLRFKKVLIVLDDIDHGDHLDYLAGDLGWFGNGSRIIVTTRNKHLIRKNDVVYEVTTLLDHDAIQLFNHYAFKEEVPDDYFEKFSLEVVSHAKGLPLALKLWGSFFYKRDKAEWRYAIEQMKINSNSEIVEKLKISYDGLETIQRDIFLDIACFLRGKEKDYVMQILESCYSRANIELSILIDKSLVFISEDHMIQMHDCIQDMGRYIVKREKHPGERSRLWNVEEFEEMMINNTGTKAMEAIWLQGIQNLCFRKEAMKNMIWLRILYIRGFLKHDDSIEYLPNNLHWFDCYKYPWETLPENFEPKRLVYLELQRSSLRHLWSDMTKHLPSLRKLNLSFSKRLMQTPDFTWIPKLEYLHLRECTSLKEVHHSLGYSKNLILLNLCYCESLERFTCVSGESLEYLYLHGCGSLETFPKILGTMKPELEIHTAYSGIRELPSSIIQHLAHLTELNLSAMENLVALPCSICELRGLVKLDVSYCSKLESLPENIGDLENLEKLNARHTLISQPPSSIVRLNKLKFLTFAKQQSEVGHEDGVYFVFPQVNKGLLSLEYLDLSYCNVIDGLPEDIGSLFSLKKLYLQGNNFEHLPQSMAQLGALQSLYLLDCTRLTQLPEFPQLLVTIYADWSNDSICDSLFQNISSLQHDISASDSLSLRMFTTGGRNIPSWFHHQGMDRSVSVNLPENWYEADNFLGFAVCCSGSLIETTVHLISYDGMLQITQKLALCNPSKRDTRSTLYFFLVPFAGLWDTSKANGKTPNDHGLIRLCFSGEIEYGLRLLYKDEPKLEVLLQTRESNDERCIRARMSRYDSSEHHDSVTNEAGCSSSKTQIVTQIVTFLKFMGTLLLRICSNN